MLIPEQELQDISKLFIDVPDPTPYQKK